MIFVYCSIRTHSTLEGTKRLEETKLNISVSTGAYIKGPVILEESIQHSIKKTNKQAKQYAHRAKFSTNKMDYN